MSQIARRLFSVASRRFASTSKAPAAPAVSSGSSQKYLKITLMRSCIGLAPDVRKTVEALGFKKRMQTLYHRIDGGTVGRVLKIKELVKVEEVTEEKMLEETAPKDRHANKGYSVVGSVL